MNCIGSMLPIWLSPATLIVLRHMDIFAFIADLSGVYVKLWGELVVLWPMKFLVPYQDNYQYGNILKRQGINLSLRDSGLRQPYSAPMTITSGIAHDKTASPYCRTQIINVEPGWCTARLLSDDD